MRRRERRIEAVKGGYTIMERIKTIETRDLAKSAKNGGCGECLPVCMQDLLWCCQSAVRESEQVITAQSGEAAAMIIPTGRISGGLFFSSSRTDSSD